MVQTALELLASDRYLQKGMGPDLPRSSLAGILESGSQPRESWQEDERMTRCATQSAPGLRGFARRLHAGLPLRNPLLSSNDTFKKGSNPEVRWPFALHTRLACDRKKPHCSKRR
jgi:hypothetical protein